jgi:hypothetical protein
MRASVLFCTLAWTAAITAFCTPVLAQLPGEKLERIEFTLGDSDWRIEMPKGSKLRPGPDCVQVWHPRSTRLVKFLELCARGTPATDGTPREIILRNGARVVYSINSDIGGGSGGSESELKGSLELKGRMFALTCRDQGEWSTDPSWCLLYLHSLAVADRN